MSLGAGPTFGGYSYGPYSAGPRFIESLDMIDYVEDWSSVRSPSRAARRMKQGHRQNVRTIAIPKKEAITMDGGLTFYVHPEMMRELRRHTQAA
jgi:hypothetical protein